MHGGQQVRCKCQQISAVESRMDDKPGVGFHCPKCHGFRVMDGYSRADLKRLLGAGEPIRGWCQTCGEDWILTEKERGGIAKGLAEGL
jgi:hypothetical protein